MTKQALMSNYGENTYPAIKPADTHPVIGRLDRPNHLTISATPLNGAIMDQPIKLEDCGLNFKKYWTLR